MKVLGLSPHHDSSACLIVDGKIEKYFKEERLNRVKRSNGPRLSLKNCLDGIDRIDYFSYSEFSHAILNEKKYFHNHANDWLKLVKKYCSVENFEIFSPTHHIQHASSTFYSSGFDEAAVIVIDAKGSSFEGLSETETIFHASYPNNFIEVYKAYSKDPGFNEQHLLEQQNRMPDCEMVAKSDIGITLLYCTATQLIKQDLLENGKTMGLSAYGKNRGLYDEFFLPGTSVVDMKSFIIEKELLSESSIFKKFYHKDHKNKSSEVTTSNYHFYADYAFHVQKETEKAVELLVAKAIEKTGLKNVCLGGGYGLNVVNNLQLLKNFPDIKFFFDPMSDDSGVSIGGANLLYRSITQSKEINPAKNNFIHGKKHDLSKIKGDIVNYMDIAKIINSQKTVAMYYGLAEAGPRALGHRSILFDPRNKRGKEIVNKIKKREWYRPFAASMLKDEADKYFDYVDNIGYQYMTINALAKRGTKSVVPSIVHQDGSCRIHIVEEKEEPLYKLLTSFKELTGLGILLNTSFNLAGEPLVETPEDAIDSWSSSELYCLWFPEIETSIFK